MSIGIKGSGLTLLWLLCVAPVANAQLATIGALAAKIFNDLIESGNQQAIRDEVNKQQLSDVDRKRGVAEATVRATMSPPQGRIVAMNGIVLRLAPGAKIKDSKTEFSNLAVSSG